MKQINIKQYRYFQWWYYSTGGILVPWSSTIVPPLLTKSLNFRDFFFSKIKKSKKLLGSEKKSKIFPREVCLNSDLKKSLPQWWYYSTAWW